MSILRRLVLVALLFKTVQSQGFGEFDRDDDEDEILRVNGDRDEGGKKSPFEIQDDEISPQQTLDERMKAPASERFSEKLPLGTLKFGDALLSDYQDARLFTDDISIGQVVVNDEKLRWKDAVIPYEIDCSLINLKDAMAAIEAAMKEWESKTCLRFVERKKEEKYLRFFRDTSCWGHVGMHDYSSISVGYGCERQNVMAHEIGHAIGFYHEHNRKDRDQYVKVNYDNINDGDDDAFERVKNGYSFGVAYDYSSIMHYPWDAFSKDSSKTMEPLHKTYKTPYKSISVNDVKQVRLMYKCDEVEKKWKQFEKLARLSTPQRASIPRPPNADEWGIFFSSQSAPGEAGCVDWSKHCADWAGAGYCQTQAVVREYCKKTCNEPVCTANECKDRHAKCKSFGRFCKHDSYKKWMGENCCAFCSKKVVPKCRDTKQFCKEYAKYGYCSSSKNFRETYCCRTCKDIATKTKPKETCAKDVLQNCQALQDKDYCNTRKDYMKRNCCVTCRNKPKKTCNKDKRTDCSRLKKLGYCTRNKMYMATECCVTCRDTDKKVVKKKCTGDIEKDCAELKKKGYCESRKAQMKEKCCVTCKGTVCSKPVKSLLVQPLNTQYPTFLGTGRLCALVKDWNPVKCPGWKRSGWCKTKPKEMHLWCKKSCKFCDDGVLRPEGACSNPLGLSFDGRRSQLPDSSFKSAQPHLVTGSWSAGPQNARLYFEDDHVNKRIGGWCSMTGKSTLQNLESVTVDLRAKKRITHIATQGRDKYFERVSKFKIEYSNTGEDDDFCPYLENGVEKVFEGNCDYLTPVLNQFWTPLEAQFIKFIPWGYNYPCVRMEFYGCDVTEIQPVP